MTNLEIRINIKRITDYSSDLLNKSIDKKTVLSIIESFAGYIRIMYISMIEEAINSRRYKGAWEPVDDEGYIDYLGVTPTVDIIYLIAEALEVKKLGYNFVVRIDPHYKYPGTKHRLVTVLRAIDNGTTKFNGRPIFNKILREIRSNILELWKIYLAKKRLL